MKRLEFLIVVVFTISACGGSSETTPAAGAAARESAAAGQPGALPAIWVVTEGVQMPESAYFDVASGFIYTSQIVGAPDGRDGDGRIMKLDREGKVIAATWVTGLNAPKGLRACEGTLWTADLDELVGIDVASGKITSHVRIAGAQSLNDVACGGDGTVYVSDMMASRIYAMKNGQASMFAEGEQLEYPNGLLVDAGRLIVGGWGSKPKADFTTDVKGHLFALDLTTKEKTLITPSPLANIDGLESDGHGGYLVTDYLAGKLLQVPTTGDVRQVAQFTPGAADFGIVPEAHVIIIPHMNENRVAAYNIAEALQ